MSLSALMLDIVTIAHAQIYPSKIEPEAIIERAQSFLDLCDFSGLLIFF